MKRAIIFFLMVLLVIPIVLSAPPLQVFIGDTKGLEIRSTLFPAIKVNNNFDFTFHVFNKSDGLLMTNETVTCYFCLFNNTGDHVARIDNKDIEFDDGVDFVVSVTASNFSETGDFHYIMQCNTTAVGGFISYFFKVTPTGTEIDETQGLVSIGLIISIILLAFMFCFYGYRFSETKDLFPVALFFIALSLFLGVYSLHLGYIFTRDILYPLAGEGAQFKMYFGIMWGLMAVSFIAMLFLLIKTLKEAFKKRNLERHGEGYDPKTKTYR